MARSLAKSSTSARCTRPGLPGAKLAKKLNAWWWNWKVASGLPATALFQPPLYHFQLTLAPLRRSPIVGSVCSGRNGPPSENGHEDGCMVFTARKLPFTSTAEVSLPSGALRLGVPSGFSTAGQSLPVVGTGPVASAAVAASPAEIAGVGSVAGMDDAIAAGKPFSVEAGSGALVGP